MIHRITFGIVAALLVGSVPAVAETSATASYSNSSVNSQELPAYLQCVPYAREQSGIQIYGDAHTWWDQAEGKFDRGNRPKVGAVMAFQPHRNMRLGHVAAVSKVIDSRTVLLRHSNWSPINGRRGQIENDVRAIDVSATNDWSQVRVWYDPIQGLGKSPWPIHGFIYPEKARSFSQPVQVARAAPQSRSAAQAPVRPARTTSPAFANAFASLEAKPLPRPANAQSRNQSQRASRHQQPRVAAPVIRQAVQRVQPAPQTRSDDFSDVLAKYDN
ncbi:hypothetical protein GCM10023115_10650 [Pontixanthobacter gangjinensis]|uniref:CHAP domain-containing protein n=1 Tax=Pontixanthobacter gangjinensis TaxID=1028742 RepID=A0A6I4SKC5_9SPHN|nr:CHAP domain-containing protein [Pontixanthobacter gangjinensis]MXO56311.1 CHAP domain-containing protein [Pontixanthobacter gangjinensis]